jgi:hypothetical protein
MSDTTLEFHELSFLYEGDHVLVGRPGIDSYAVLPLDGAKLLERMVAGSSSLDAAAWYAATYGESVDMASFVETIRELGFVRDLGADRETVTAEAVGLQRFARLLFAPAAFLGYALVFVAWLITILRVPALAPNPRHVFFTRSLVLVQLLILFGQIPCLFLHESFHVLAGRRLGLSSRVGLGNRLWFIVVETRMPNLLSVPRRQRYLPFLVGMLADVLIVSTLGLLAYGMHDGGKVEQVIAAVALAMAFPVCVRFAYQFLLFLQTDIYFVITTALGCYDLHAASRALVLNRMWRLLRHPERVRDGDAWTPRDRQVARWYAPLFAIGAAVLLAVFTWGLVPVIRECIDLISTAVGIGPTRVRFWDALLFVVLTAVQFGVYFYLLLRNRRRNPPASTAASPTRTSLEPEYS